MNRDRMVTAAMIASGDIVNIGQHFLTPSIQHSAATGCVICGDSHSLSEKKCKPNTAVEMQQLLVAATSNDLDLQKTGADSVRQLFHFGTDIHRDFRSANDQLLLRFLADMSLHVGYLCQSLKPLKQDALHLKYHSLILFFIALEEEKTNNSEWKMWIKRVLSRSQRTVIMTPLHTTRLWNECLADAAEIAQKTSMIYFSDLQSLLRILLHTSMITKHRVSVDDIRRADKSDSLVIVPSMDRQAYLFF